jgi:hypothetical protein
MTESAPAELGVHQVTGGAPTRCTPCWPATLTAG